MRQLLADTSFLVALVDAGDIHHAEAVAFLPQLREAIVIVTDYVFDKMMTFLKRRLGSEVVLRAGRQLRESLVFQRLHTVTKAFPREETYSLVDQIRRSSRSVCANIAEAWRKRRYEAAFISKPSDAEAEAAETQVWLQFSVDCGYLAQETGHELHQVYDYVIGKLVSMIANPRPWLLPRRDTR